MDTVNILGTEYKLSRYTRDECAFFKKHQMVGMTDEILKEIAVVDTTTLEEVDDKPLEWLLEYEKEILRHEVIHAYLGESGLKDSTKGSFGPWAKDEEMIDWFAIMSRRLSRTWEETDAWITEVFKTVKEKSSQETRKSNAELIELSMTEPIEVERTLDREEAESESREPSTAHDILMQIFNYLSNWHANVKKANVEIKDSVGEHIYQDATEDSGIVQEQKDQYDSEPEHTHEPEVEAESEDPLGVMREFVSNEFVAIGNQSVLTLQEIYDFYRENSTKYNPFYEFPEFVEDFSVVLKQIFGITTNLKSTSSPTRRIRGITFKDTYLQEHPTAGQDS